MEQDKPERQYRLYRYRAIVSKKTEQRIEEHFQATQKIFNFLRAENLKATQANGRELPLKELIRLSFEEVKKFEGINRSIAYPTAYRLYAGNESAHRHGKPTVMEKVVGANDASFSINFYRKNVTPAGKKRAKITIGGIGEVTIVYHRPLPEGAECRQLIVRRNASRQYFVMLGITIPKPVLPPLLVKKAIGLDFSVPKLYVSSDKEIAPDPAKIHQYEGFEPRISKAQAKLSRLKRGGKNYEKQRLKLARLYQKVENRRRDFLHKETKRLAKEFDFIGVETLSIKQIEMRQNLARHVLDDSWARFLFLLRYKMKEANKILRFVPVYYPSSKTCHRCGYINHGLTLSDRIFECPHCHAKIDRDYNAAKNIRDKALRDAGFRIHYIPVAATT